MDIKEIIAYTALSISSANFIWYMYTVYCGKTRPHLYTWLIWGLVTGVACFAQFSAGGGRGAWITLAVTFFCFGRVIAAFTHGVKDITRGDKFCLAAAIIAIVLWRLTDNALLAVIIVTLIDLSGFYPTVRNAWMRPQDENLFSYFLFCVTYMLSLISLDQYNTTTLFYPVLIVTANLGFVAFGLMRRAVLKQTQRST